MNYRYVIIWSVQHKSNHWFHALQANAAGCFSLIADETSDISRKEQLSVSLRYVDISGDQLVVKEDFLCMVEVRDLTGAGLKEKMKETLAAHSK